MDNSKHLMRKEYTMDYGCYSEDRVMLFDDRDYTDEQLNEILHEGKMYEEKVINKKLIDVNLQTYNTVFRSLLTGGED